MSKEIIPATGRLLIQPITVEATSDGGILLSNMAIAELNHAEVLAVGLGKLIVGGERMSVEFNVGDIVIYGNRQDTVEDTLHSKSVLLVVEQCIVAVVKE